MVILAPTSVDDAILGIPRRLTSACAFSEAYKAPPLGSYVGCSSSGFEVDLVGRVLAKPLRTVNSIPPKLRLGCARVFLQTLDVVLACPSDISVWVQVQLLILPYSVLGAFLPKNRGEQRSGMREPCQFDNISSVGHALTNYTSMSTILSRWGTKQVSILILIVRGSIL